MARQKTNNNLVGASKELAIEAMLAKGRDLSTKLFEFGIQWLAPKRTRFICELDVKVRVLFEGERRHCQNKRLILQLSKKLAINKCNIHFIHQPERNIFIYIYMIIDFDHALI